MSSRSASRVRNLLNRDGRYYARLTVPDALRPAMGRRELLEPLGPDRKDALRKLPGAVGRMHDQLNVAREDKQPVRPVRVQPGRPMTDRTMAVAHYQQELTLDEAARTQGAHTVS